MCFRATTFVICSLLAPLLASPLDDVWHPPQPAPRDCGTIQFEVMLLDVSRSMRRGGLFDQQRKSIENYLASTTRACTLVIVGSFGITADVHEAQFLTSPENRARLVAAVRRLSPTHPSTNLDEAAKLIELLSYQLRAAYGIPANRLVVRVYSDFESSPSFGKPNFSLGEYLAHRMRGRYIRDSTSDTHEETVQVLSTTPLEANQPVTPPQPRRRGSSLFAATLVGIALVMTLSFTLWVRRRTGRRVDVGVGPVALQVTEWVTCSGEAAAEMVGPERRVEVATGVPVVFSTDVSSATYIAAAVLDGTNGELFRVEPLPDGTIRINSPHPRLTVNGEPLDADRRLKVDIHQPIRVRLGLREFNIVGVFGRARAFERSDDVFDAEPLQH